MPTTSKCNRVGNFNFLPFSFFHSLPIYFHCCHIVNICSQKKEDSFCKLSAFAFYQVPSNSIFIHYCYGIFIYSIVWLHLALQNVSNDRTMCYDTHDSPSQRSLLHVPLQAQLVILFEIRSNLCRSRNRIICKTSHAFETFQPSEGKNQKLFRMFQKFESFKLYQIHSVPCFHFKNSERKISTSLKKKRASIEDRFKALQEIQNG